MTLSSALRSRTSVIVILYIAICVMVSLRLTRISSRLLLSPPLLYPNVNETSLSDMLSSPTVSKSLQTIQHKSRGDVLKLRFDWTNLDRLSPWSHYIASYQSNCSLPVAGFNFRSAGLGSNLHVYSISMCNAMQTGRYRLRSMFPWTHMDSASCAAAASAVNNQLRSPLSCYFSEPETVCPNDSVETNKSKILNREEMVGNRCEKILRNVSIPAYRAATMEYLFSRVSPLVVEEAERQLRLLFGNNSRVPSNLITVHIRWGDKKEEMKLVPIVEYVNAVHELVKGDPDLQSGASIFLATEDPEALAAFRKAAPVNWTIYVDQYYTETLADRDGSSYGMTRMTSKLSGRPGLVALGSLLVAMEANRFVLTTASNWSRLMDELRRNIIDPRCNNCSRMIDLRPGSGYKNI